MASRESLKSKQVALGDQVLDINRGIYTFQIPVMNSWNLKRRPSHTFAMRNS